MDLSTEELKRVFRLQKGAARMILQVDTRSRTVDNFTKLGWMPFYDEVKMNICILILKKLNADVPSYIDELFITNKSIHSRQTRHGGYNLVCPRYNRSSEVGKSFTISSIKSWNSLPQSKVLLFLKVPLENILW